MKGQFIFYLPNTHSTSAQYRFLMLLISGLSLFSSMESHAQNQIPLCTTTLTMTNVGPAGINNPPYSWSYPAGLTFSCNNCLVVPTITAASPGTYYTTITFTGNSLVYVLTFGAGDADGDGSNACDDCNDNSFYERPGQVWYKDSDNDGYAQTGAATIMQCNRPGGYKAQGELTSTTGDCNDNNAAIKPGAPEICNLIDDNCNGSIDDGINCCPSGNVLYVKANAGGANDGSSWADAFTDLQTALTKAGLCPGITQIWVAAGTYKPTSGTNRSAAFVMKNNLAIYGGFPNTGNPTFSNRNWATHTTILSGDIGATGNNADNCYHVIFNDNNGLNNTAVLDGFTITGGNANDLNTSNTTGGGMYNYNSSPTVNNCIFSGNSALQFGGGVVLWQSSSALTNCLLAGNTSDNGGALLVDSASPTLTNCTFSGNSATTSGGAIYNLLASPNIKNCILWGNGSEIGNAASSPNVTYSIVQGGYPGTGNLNIDPLFVNAANGNFRLQSCSPAINAGSNAAVPSGINADLDGNLRFFNSGVVDMGAYELQSMPPAITCYQDNDGDTYGNPAVSGVFCGTCGTGYVSNNLDCNDNNPAINPAATEICDGVDNNCNGQTDEGNVCCPTGNVLFVNAAATGANTGASWADAFTDLQSALGSTCPGITEIWVAAGTYKPTSGADRSISFVMKNNLAIYGGFPNTGNPAWADRNGSANVTILSGDIGTVGDNGDNSYHVIFNNGLNNTAVLDGFTIEGGNANVIGNSLNNAGGGIYNFGSSPKVANCIFSGNSAYRGGNGMYNENSSPNVNNCIFSGNVGGNTGGGMLNHNSSPNVTNCTFSGNFTSFGGGIHNAAASSPTVTNCILWGNSSGIQNSTSSSTPTVTHSIVQGGYPGTGNLDTDPLFVDATNGNLRLQAASCAINAGSNAAVPSGVTTDLDGNPRIYNGVTVDMGAYEFQGLRQPLTTPPVTTNNALHFDGSNDYVQVMAVDEDCNGAILGGGDAITIEYWFKGSNLQSAVRIQYENDFILAGWGASNNLQHILSNDGGTNGLPVGAAATDGNWHHVAMTWQRNTVNGFKSYLDGQLVAQRNSSDTPLPAISTIRLGSYNNGEYTNGALDEVRIWNVARTQAQIQASLCSGSLTLPQSGLQVYYKFDHGTAAGGNTGINTLLNSANPGTFTGVLYNFALSSSASNWIAGGPAAVTCYQDNDGDTYGNPAVSQVFCGTCGTGFVSNSNDCDDTNPDIKPAATEICDGVDNNCNGQTDEGNVCCPTGNVLYVKANATGANDGTSWANAFTDLQNALAKANQCTVITEIWVAAGTYKPTSGTDRSISFVMKNNLAIYGGFPNTGNPVWADRNWATNVTILSGDIGTVGNSGDNSYHVIFNNNNGLTSTAKLDGFTITGGNANGGSSNNDGGGMYNSSSSPTVTNCIFSGNSATLDGGGMFNKNSSSPTVTNCTFSGNSATFGGGMSNKNSSSPTVTNCTFSGNSATVGGGMSNVFSSSPPVSNCTFSGNSASVVGGGMYNFVSSPTVSNCTFSGNSASVEGGGMFNNDSSSPTVSNCIFWGNGGGEIISFASNPTVTHSIVQGGYPGTGNLDLDPLFVNAANGNLRLQAASCAINTGDNAAVPSGVTTDLDGNPRFYNNGTVDMGAYEFQGEKVPFVIPTPPLTTNNGLHFDGTDDFVNVLAVDENCTGAPLGGGDAITIEYWFKGSNLQSAVRIQYENNFILAGWGASNDLKHILSNDGGTSGLSVGAAATDGNWHHVAMTWQRNTVNGFKSYLDGQLVAQRNSSNTPLPAISTIRLGSYNNGEYTNGTLDEVRIWNVAKTQAQIQAGLCSGSLTLPQTGLQVYYQFDHGTAAGDNAGINTLLNSANPGTFTGVLNNFALDSLASNWVGGAPPATIWYADTDNDGAGDPGSTVPACIQPSGYVSNSNDQCPNDPNKTAPGACGCGVPDVATTWYADTDGDGDGDPNDSQSGFSCNQPSGYVSNSNDQCPNDPDKTAPGACGCGVPDVATTWYADTDGDGDGDPNDSQSGFSCNQPSGYVSNSNDQCPNDPDKTAPGACGCGVADVATTWYADTDGDGAGDPNNSQNGFSCIQPSGYVSNNLDCDDTNPDINPGATEICDGVDNNCNGQTDEGNVCCPAGNVLFVNAAATGANTGASWADAFTDLQSALNSTCPDITQIWVAAGAYKPTSGTDRSISFVMKNNLAIYGGFPNTGNPAWADRDWATNVTILSGDIGTVGDNSDNSYHVIFNNNNGLNNTALLDGFTITGGNADGNFPNDYGGGIFNDFSSPSVVNCVFSGNEARYGGGAMTNAASSSSVTNCIFTGNSAGFGGGAVAHSYDFSSISNCSFFGNSAPNGGGIFNTLLSSPTVTNCILWGNSSGVFNNNSNSTVTYSIVQGGYTGTGNLDADPLFVDAANGNFRLQSCSPAINAGNNAAVPMGITTDLAGNPRFFNSGVVDMGAYEFQSTPDPCLCTDLRTWTGAIDTDWNTGGNWNPACVPTADNPVLIPDVTNDPVIGASVAALAKSVHVQPDGSLTIQNMGSLTINGSFDHGAYTAGFRNQGTVANSGELILGATGSVGNYGLWNQGVFNNNSGGEISLDQTDLMGLLNDQGTFTNSAKIAIGMSAGVGQYGLENRAIFNNNSGGDIAIDGASEICLLNESGAFANTAKITIGSATAGNYGIWNKASFHNNAGGDIQIDRSAFYGLYNQTGTFSNSAKILLGANVALGAIGILNMTAFDNNSGGDISIDGPYFTGLYNDDSTFTNSAKITIGANFGMGDYGIWNQATFYNYSGGEISIDSTSTSGLYNHSGAFTNAAKITIGANHVAGYYGLQNQATFENNNGGEISIDRASLSGLYNSSGAFSNAASIVIGATAAVGIQGIFNQATFENNSGGEISIDRSSGIGLFNQLAGFANAGNITIGAIADVGDTGIRNEGSFDNESGGEIKVDRCEDHGLFHNSGIFNNAAKISIGATNDVGGTGIINLATFNNNGEISIDRYADYGLNNISGAFTNAAKIVIAAGYYGLNNGATFQNNACAELYLYGPLFNTSSFTNGGLMLVGATGSHTNNALTNNGIIAYPLGNPIPNVTNNEIIVGPTISGNCQSVSPAFSLGNPVDFSIQGIYTDADATVSAGAYAVATNTFTPTAALSDGDMYDYFVKIEDGIGGCTRILPWQVTVLDDTPPTATCQDITISLDGNGNATILPADVFDGGTDNCGTAGPQAVAPDAFTCANLGANTVTLTVSDGNGNNNTCTATVTVQDDTLPTITCPGAATVNCSGQIPAVNLAAATASDNCGAPVKSHVGDVISNQTCASRKTVTRTYRATDGSGNSSTCSQVITVFDNAAPNFTSVPANVTVQCNSVPTVGTPSATDGCGGSVTVTYNGQTQTNGACTDSYTLTRQWTATDACGNTKTATQRIVVTDTQKPNFTNVPVNVTVQCDAIPAVAAPTATDNCDATVAVTYNGQTQTNGACPNAYTLTRRWTAADNCGNTRTVTQRIVVVDNGKPVFMSFPANTTIACNDTPPPVGSPSASDACGSATVTYLGQTSVSGSCPGNYQLRRTWRATDACGNSTVSTQTIQVSDTGAPVFTSTPGPLTIECGDPLPPLVNPTASDACGFAFVTFLGNVPSGSGCAADYTVTRTWRAEDLCGNTATTSLVITVLGNSYGGDDPAGVSAQANNGTRMTQMRHGFTRIGQLDSEEKSVEIRVSSVSHPATLGLQPNPSSDRIWLDLTDFTGEAVTVSIFSDLGQLVWERSIPAVEDLNLSVSLREAGAVSGIYTVTVRSKGGVVAKRVVLAE